MKYNRLTRRHFLQGAGKSFLSLPFLPSLMSTAEAQTLPNSKCMVFFWSGHGGIGTQNMYPIDSNPAVASQLSSQMLYSSFGHTYRSASLKNLKTTRAANLPYLANSLGYNLQGAKGAPEVAAYANGPSGSDLDGGAARVTPIIGNFVSDSLLAKMNLITGLDMMYYTAHTSGQTGNYCNYSGNSLTAAGNTTEGMPNVWVPTIDSLIASNPEFYGSSSPIARSVLLNPDYVDPYISCSRIGSTITPNANAPTTVGAAFNLLFNSLKQNSNSSVLDKKNFILNNVYQDYSRLAKGAFGPGRRIGKEDRSRLEEFMSNLNSVLTGVISNSGASCSIPPASASDSSRLESAEYGASTAQTMNVLALNNQIISAAFACGVSKMFVVGMPNLYSRFIPEGSSGATFSDGLGNTDSHQGVYHLHNITNRQQLLLEGNRFYFRYGFYDLMQRLDAASATGGTLLDQSFLCWVNESGFRTHEGQSLPIFTAGSAGNSFSTGNFLDFRNVNRPIYRYENIVFYQGLPYNRFLGSVLQGMGVAPTSYELSASLFAGNYGRVATTNRGTVPGYGHPFQGKYQTSANGTPEYIYDYALNDMSAPLPGLVK